MFYDVLTKLCQENNKSLVQVRKDLGISQSTMASWKARGVTPNAATVAQMSEYFKVSVDYLLERDTESTPITSHMSADVIQIANILEVPPNKQAQFDRSYKMFVSIVKKLCDLSSSVPLEERPTDTVLEIQQTILMLKNVTEILNEINPEGFYTLPMKYKKWTNDMTAFSKVYSLLNDKGQHKAIERVRELAKIPEYQRFPITTTLTIDEMEKIQSAQDKIREAECELRSMEQQGKTNGSAVESYKQIISEAQRQIGEIMLSNILEGQ